MEKSKITEEMQALLKIKLKYFKIFHDISIEQKKIVTQDDEKLSQKKRVLSIDNSKIEVLLLKRDAIISKILDIDKQIEFMLKNNPSLESNLVESNIIKSFNRQIKEVIDKIVPIEKEVTSMLEKHKNLLKESFNTVRKGKTLITSYGNKQFIRPRFIDYKLQ